MSLILIVDDEDLFRKMLTLRLTRMGFEVAEARNGNEALQLHQRLHPDVMLTDLIMPEMEGIETIRRLKARFPSAKIVAMSGGGRLPAGDYLKMATIMGADRVLAKPFSNEELKVAVEEVLSHA